MGASVDLVENARVARLLNAAAPTAKQIAAASQATVAKTVIVSLALAVLLLSLSMAALRWFRAR